jgi:ATP-dependent Clp endopeptidase proteolytic subunit ClpP
MATAEGKSWYEFRQAVDGGVEVYLYEEIGLWGITASQFQKDWKAAIKGAKRVDVRLNSPGGSVSDGTAIYNLIKQSKPEVTVWIDGIAASVAATIAMAGDKVVMGANTLLMVHNPWSFAMGDARELRRMADVLDKFKDSSMTAYVEKSGKTTEEVAAIMDAETWYTAQEAVDAGFADEVVDAPVVKASWDVNKFGYLQSDRVRAAFVQAAEENPEPSTVEVIDMADETPKQEQPDLNKIRQEAADEARTAERERVAQIRAAAFDGQDELIDKLINEGTPALEAVVQINRAQKARGVEALQALEAQSKAIAVENNGAPEVRVPVLAPESALQSFKRVYLQEGKDEVTAERMARKAVGLT